MPNEIWKDVDGWVGFYQISTNGGVRSLDRKTKSRPAKGQKIKPILINSGYLSTSFSNGKKVKRYLIHRLMAMAFLPRIVGKDFVNHKNGIKTDNRIENLEWCTKSYNLLHAYELGHKTITEKHLTRLRKFNTETKSIPVSQYTKDGIFIARYSSVVEASEKTGCNYPNIHLCAKGHPHHKTCGGYVWKKES